MIKFVALFFLLSATAWSQTTLTPPDPTPEALKAEAARLIKSATIMLSLAQNAAQQAAVAQGSVQPAVVHSETVSIPADIRDAVFSLCGILITAGIGAGLTWMRAHFAFMKEAGANAAITSSAQNLGALLEQALAKQGKSLSSVEISDPTVAAFARKLIASYPEWGPLVGLTQDIAERKVMGGAIEQSTVPLVPSAVPKPVSVEPPHEQGIIQ